MCCSKDRDKGGGRGRPEQKTEEGRMRLEVYPRVFGFLLIHFFSYCETSIHRYQLYTISLLHIIMPDIIGFPLRFKTPGPHYFYNIKLRLSLIDQHSHLAARLFFILVTQKDLDQVCPIHIRKHLLRFIVAAKTRRSTFRYD